MLDSSIALARTPLFAHMSRIELAKLAGELIEQQFVPGAVIVREGDQGDAFYIVKSGQARVVVGPNDSVTLRPGDGFGEMALLADVPRTATVVAQSPVQVWRLPVDEFRALLQREHGIALCITRALTLRLAHRTREIADLQALAQTVSAFAFRTLSPEAQRLLQMVRLIEVWPRDALVRACQRIGRDAALLELQSGDLFLRRDGDKLVVLPLLSGSPTDSVELDPAWLTAITAELEAAGDILAATTLHLRAGSYESAVGLLLSGHRPLLASTPPDQLARWLNEGADARIRIEPRLDALREEVVRRLAEAAEPSTGGGLAGLHHLHLLDARALVAPLARTVQSRQVVGALAAAALYAAGWLLPTPAGLDRPALVVLAALCAIVPLTVLRVVPDYVAGIVLAASLVVPKTVGAPQMLSGFGSTGWLLLLLLFAVSTSIAHSGLLYRVALLSLQRLPSSFFVQSLVLAGAGLLLSIGISNGSSRVALAAPAARDIADALHYPRRSKGSAALGLVGFLSYSELSNTFLTGSTWVLLLYGLMPPAEHVRFTWGFWFVAAVLPNAIFFVLSYTAIALIFRPPHRGEVDLSTVRIQHELLGPVTRAEAISAIALLGLIAAYVTQSYHGIQPVWVAAAIFVFLFASGTLTPATFQGGVNWGLLLYAGVLLGVGPVFQSLKIGSWIGSGLQQVLQGSAASPYTFVLAIGVAAFALRFVMPLGTLMPVMALVTMPLAISVGYSPFVPIMTILMLGEHSFLPYINPTYLAMYHMSDGDLFSHEQARPVLWLEVLFRLIAVLASVPYWRALGLL